jgi:hypothetical protein
MVKTTKVCKGNLWSYKVLSKHFVCLSFFFFILSKFSVRLFYLLSLQRLILRLLSLCGSKIRLARLRSLPFAQNNLAWQHIVEQVLTFMFHKFFTKLVNNYNFGLWLIEKVAFFVMRLLKIQSSFLTIDLIQTRLYLLLNRL